MGLGVGESPKVMVGNDEGVVVGQGYLLILLALGKKVLIVEQTQVVVALGVSDFQPEGYQCCL